LGNWRDPPGPVRQGAAEAALGPDPEGVGAGHSTVIRERDNRTPPEGRPGSRITGWKENRWVSADKANPPVKKRPFSDWRLTRRWGTIRGRAVCGRTLRTVRRGLRHEVAGVIVWRDEILTRPAVPSAVPYEVRRRGNGPSKSPRTTNPPPSGGHSNREARVHRQASCGAGPGWMAWLTQVNSR